MGERIVFQFLTFAQRIACIYSKEWGFDQIPVECDNKPAQYYKEVFRYSTSYIQELGFKNQGNMDLEILNTLQLVQKMYSKDVV